jgi:hypothetical protein
LQHLIQIARSHHSSSHWTSGIANVTVINGGAEAIIPVLVELPHASGSTLGTNGGAVRAVDGAIVTIAPGALATDTPVSIQQLSQAQLTVPLNDQFNFVGAFKLDVGTQDLTTPVQLALPAPSGAVVGQEVFFMRQDTIPDANGRTRPIWIIVESGKVGADGMVRSTSEPWPGAYRSGTYTVATPNFAYQIAFTKAVLDDLKAFYGAALLALSSGTLVGAVGTLVATEIILTNKAFSNPGQSAYLPMLTPIGRTGFETIVVPRIGLPYSTYANETTGSVQLNLNQVRTVSVKIPTPPLEAIDPQIQKVEIAAGKANSSATNGATLIYIHGQNFGNDLSKLKVKFTGATGETVNLSISQASSNLSENVLAVVPTARDFFGLNSKLQVERNITTNNGTPSLILKSKILPINVNLPSDNLALVPQSFGRSISVFRTDNYTDIISQNQDNSNLLVAKIPVGQIGSTTDGPRYVAVTSDRQRAYTTLEGSSQIAAIDLLTLQQVDISHEPGYSLPDNNPTIDLPPGARPFAIAIDLGDKYAYISDRNSYNGKGLIYVLDIDPQSSTFHKVVKNISVDRVASSLGQMKIDPTGKYLFAINPNSTTPGKGEIVVIDLSLGQQVDSFVIDGAPTGIDFASKTDAHITKVLFTKRQDDARGVGVITITDNNFAAAPINYIPLNLGSPFDYFDVNEGVSITITSDGKYGFVAGRNSRNLGQEIKSVDADYRGGSNIGIIKDPLTANAKLVAATRPIYGAAFNGVALSGDDKVVMGVDQISGSVFAFDVEQIIKTIDNPGAYYIQSNGFNPAGYPEILSNPSLINLSIPTPATLTDLTRFPIDDINPLVDWVAGDLRHLQTYTGLAVPVNSPTPPLGIGGNPYSVTTVHKVQPLKSETKYLIDQNILNLNGIPDEKIVIQQNVTNPIANGVVYGEAISLSSNLVKTLPPIAETEKLIGLPGLVVDGAKDLVLIGKEVLTKGGEVIGIPGAAIGFAVLGVVLVTAAIATDIQTAEMNLTISTSPPGEGLGITDNGFVKRPSAAPEGALYTDRNGVKDYNPNRVFTQ